jgi:DNA-binding MarR family transcriptional regulator
MHVAPLVLDVELYMQHHPGMANRKQTLADDQRMEEMACGCVLTRARLISRVLTGIYDEALRPFEMGSPQFALLIVISKLAPASRADIGRFNHLDRSTLTRNLQLLLSGGWIKETSRMDGGRGRPIALTEAGRRLIIDAAPAWEAAQAKAKEALGEQAFKTLMRVGDSMMTLPEPA